MVAKWALVCCLRALPTPHGPEGEPARSLGPLMRLDSNARPDPDELIARTSPSVLAYLGDAIFETRVRERLLWPPQKLDALTKSARSLVCAEGQESLLARLVSDFPLTEEEREWLLRGRNSSGRGPRRVSVTTYRAATAFECLLGFLHIKNPTRLSQVLDFVLDTAAASDEQDAQSSPR